MAKLSKLERAKRKTRKKFRNILKRLPRLSRNDFRCMIGNPGECGFCLEYRGEAWGNCWVECPFGKQCKSMLDESRKVEEVRGVRPRESDWGGPLKLIYRVRCWRKVAEKICLKVLEEVDKVKEG